MGLEDVLTKLRSDKSVRAAFALEGNIFNDFIMEEGSVTEGAMGMKLKNRAFEEVIKRRTVICIFVEYTFETPTDHIMIMEDGCGNIIGHDVPPCMMSKYKDNPDIVWLCDDFALYPCRTQSEEPVFVMLPQKTDFIGKEEGAKDTVILYPATTTDILLRRHFGFFLDEPGIATAILGYNPI